jgi:LuxR family maltose regulon positive regulatory protein
MTSILERLCGSLCDAVLLAASASGQESLEYLERANLFIVPLDNERHWYRYHHLFADVLRMHLKAKQPDQASALQRRASEWYEHNGMHSDAIRHALAAEDLSSGDLVELAFQKCAVYRKPRARPAKNYQPIDPLNRYHATPWFPFGAARSGRGAPTA